MTTDKFLKIFKKCPVCSGKVMIENYPFFIVPCSLCGDFFGIVDFSNRTIIESIVYYHNGYRYEFNGKELFIGMDFDRMDYRVSCDEKMAIKLIKRPKLLEKYILLS